MSERKTLPPPHYVVKKKKKRGHGKFLAALIVVFLLAVGFYLLSEFIVFTPDGIEFAFGNAPAPDEDASDSIYMLPDSVTVAEPPRISIDRGELPPQGTGPIDGALLPVAGRTADEILQAAKALQAQGITSAVVPVKPADAPRITADELSWAADACEAAELRFVAYISCFRDDVTPHEDLSLGATLENGELFIDYNYKAWLNPYHAAARELVLDHCNFAVAGGARELLLDSFSFPDSGNTDAIVYGDTTVSRHTLICDFATQLREQFAVRIGVVLTGDDTFGEGASETKGQDVAHFTAQFDRLWAHAADHTAAQTAYTRLHALSVEAAQNFAAIIGERYASLDNLSN